MAPYSSSMEEASSLLFVLDDDFDRLMVAVAAMGADCVIVVVAFAARVNGVDNWDGSMSLFLPYRGAMQDRAE